MKKITLSMVMIIIAITVIAQTPQAFKYQAVARDNSGVVLSNQNVSFQISILQGSAGGASVYAETHDTLTNEFGLVNLEIGNGTVVSGVFEEIDWGNGSYFLQIEMDENGGTNYQLMGTSQLLSVPYANYAATTGDTSMWKKESQDIYYKKGNVGIGTSVPAEKLHIDGGLKFQDGTQGENKVLTSDATGKASWGNLNDLNDVNKGFTNPKYPDGTDGITPVTVKINNGSPPGPPEVYIVPPGKNLYILNVLNMNDNNSLMINEIPVTYGYYNYGTGTSSQRLSNPLVAGEGDTISGSDENYITINGYLVGLSSGGDSEGSFVDARDGNTYETVQIGSQCWMAENLAFLPFVYPSSSGSDTIPHFYVYDYQGTSVSEAKQTFNYQNYGALYNYPALFQWGPPEGICPEGWHVPARNEWDVLIDYLGGNNVAGGKMKSIRTVPSFPPPAWNSPNSGASNSSGFSCLSGGYRRFNATFSYMGSNSPFWSTTPSSAGYAWYRALHYLYDSALEDNYPLQCGFSVRCVRD